MHNFWQSQLRLAWHRFQMRKAVLFPKTMPAPSYLSANVYKALPH